MDHSTERKEKSGRATASPSEFREACSVVADLFEAIPEIWTSGTLAETEYGQTVPADSPDAARWCAVGGVCAALGLPHSSAKLGDRFRPALSRLGDKTGMAGEYQDKHGRKAAIKLLRMAAGEI